MREQLIQYVHLLFAGAPDNEDMRTEILQNTLDRYDDLVAQGKSPEAAYRLAISGIGDINEILGAQPAEAPAPQHSSSNNCEEDPKHKKLRAAGIALYILSAIPLFVLIELGYSTFGLCLTIIMVAAATYNMMITSKKDADPVEEPEQAHEASPSQKMKKSIVSLIGAVTLAVYLIVSFATGAWYITWLIFPISGCVKGLIDAIIDLKEAHKYEK